MSLPTFTGNLAAATSLASLPSVQEIFDQSRPLASLQPNQLWDLSVPINPNLYYPGSFQDGLTWTVGFLWPQLNATGPVDPEFCTPDVCSLEFGSFLYLPNVPANAFFAAFFAVMLLVSTGLSIRGRTWTYMAGMIGGLLLEIIGYIGRVMLHGDDFSGNPFYIYIICLTIGPAFLTASIYMCLSRIVVSYGQELARFKPRTYTRIFIGCDFLSLVLQGAGGGIAASFDGGSSTAQAGIDIMIAGLAFQVVSLTVFIALCADIALSVRRHSDQTERSLRGFRHGFAFRGFLSALAIATVTIYVRSVFRVAELKQGFHSQFANDEITFMVLEAAMISIATLALTLFHPAVIFGRELWHDLSRQMKPGAQILRSKASVSSDVELTTDDRPAAAFQSTRF